MTNNENLQMDVAQFISDIKTKYIFNVEASEEERNDLWVDVGGVIHDRVVESFKLTCPCDTCEENN